MNTKEANINWSDMQKKQYVWKILASNDAPKIALLNILKAAGWNEESAKTEVDILSLEDNNPLFAYAKKDYFVQNDKTPGKTIEQTAILEYLKENEMI